MKPVKAKNTLKSDKEIEADYPQHQGNPGPSRPAVEEKNDKGASRTLTWVTIVVCILLAIVYLFFIK